MSFRNRRQAGRQLGHLLTKYDLIAPVVLAVTLDGEFVGEEVAKILGTILIRTDQFPVSGTDLVGRVLVLVDDCASPVEALERLIRSMRHFKPLSVVVAVPALPHEQFERLQTEADEVVCIFAPAGPMPSSGYYDRPPLSASDFS